MFVAKSGYYDRLVFYNFLAMARQRNNKVMTSWTMISAGTNYGRGIGDIVNRRATFLGASTTTRTFLRKVTPYGKSMENNVTMALSCIHKTVWTLDNNQNGNPLNPHLLCHVYYTHQEAGLCYTKHISRPAPILPAVASNIRVYNLLLSISS